MICEFPANCHHAKITLPVLNMMCLLIGKFYVRLAMHRSHRKTSLGEAESLYVVNLAELNRIK